MKKSLRISLIEWVYNQMYQVVYVLIHNKSR